MGTFRKLQKRGNNLQKPWNASTSLETPEGHLVGILTKCPGGHNKRASGENNGLIHIPDSPSLLVSRDKISHKDVDQPRCPGGHSERVFWGRMMALLTSLISPILLY